MSYATPGSAPSQPPRSRPGTVTAATWLLLLVAALFIVEFIATVAVSGTISDVYREAYQGYEELEGTEGVQTASVVGAAALRLLLAIVLVVTAIFNHRGSNPSRIVTWVVGGIALCCAGLGLALGALLSGVQMDETQGPDPAEVQRMLEAALPDWYNPLTVTTMLISLPALIVALILLALPPSKIGRAHV